jgi:hypothetical protein
MLEKPVSATTTEQDGDPWGVFATARKRTLDAVKLVHANAPFESAADRCDFTYFDSAALCATSTADVAKLREDAQKVFSIISGDTLKIQAYCEIADLGGQLVEAAQEKDEKKTDALMQSIDELEKVLGPEYPALFNHLYEADQNSKDVQDILSMFAGYSTSPVRINSHRTSIADRNAGRASSSRARRMIEGLSPVAPALIPKLHRSSQATGGSGSELHLVTLQTPTRIASEKSRKRHATYASPLQKPWWLYPRQAPSRSPVRSSEHLCRRCTSRPHKRHPPS